MKNAIRTNTFLRVCIALCAFCAFVYLQIVHERMKNCSQVVTFVLSRKRKQTLYVA